jgi:LmbE family N-acetylglucosaminyl deacetylase
MESMLTKKKIVWLLVFASLILTASVFMYIVKERTGVYHYDVKQDYEYLFNQNRVNVTRLNLKNGTIHLPQHNMAYQTAFLSLNINSQLLGHLLQPSIKIIGQKSSFIQYVEFGADGKRYLNISPLIAQGENEIRIEGRYVSIEDQSLEFIFFENEEISQQKILIVAPHPDDAEIAAYGLYSEYNENLYILTITAGDAGSDKYDEIYSDKRKSYLKKGELRTWNSITIPLLAGVPPQRTVNLGFFDGTLEAMYENRSFIVTGLYTEISDILTFRKQNISALSNGLSGQANWNSLVANIEYLLKEIQPDIIVTPYPALDSHRDHQLSSIALFEAIKRLGIKQGELYLYTNHFILNDYYPYGKTGGIISLPPSFAGEIFFDSLVSHTLSKASQKDKLFALEAMHDLRPDTEWRFSILIIKMFLSTIRKEILGRDKSYYRRAVRSNELFFVIDIATIFDEEKFNKILSLH